MGLASASLAGSLGLLAFGPLCSERVVTSEQFRVLVDASCLGLRAWLAVWKISLFGMSEYYAMMAGVMRAVIADRDAKKVQLGTRNHGHVANPFTIKVVHSDACCG
jgi:hypothetical protein